jgi:small subunit ribosomal protein S4e
MAHQKRNELIKRIPIPRKGTTYIARANSHNSNAVPVVIAVRDMLKLARTSKEVKHMIKEKQLMINGKDVKDIHDSIKLLNVFKADKPYILSLTKTGRFTFIDHKEKQRPCKVVNKKILKGNKAQLNLHDGTNILSEDKVNTQDTIFLDSQGKLAKHVPLEKGANVFILEGKYSGHEGKVESIENGTAKVKLEDKTAELDKRRIIAI